ncbi:MAG: hypothetical protein AAGA85_23415 [Bacteroidota bacterium]
MKSKFIIGLIALGAGFFATAQEVRDPEVKERPAQVSLVFPIGTNGLDAGNYINNASFNLFAGYAYGVKGAELAGFANVLQADVVGFQGAGFANVVGGNIEGFQSAGFVNTTRGNVKGAQGAGFGNVLGGHVEGAQGAGFFNVALGSITGAQLTGGVNFAQGNVKGAQLSGLANYIGGEVTGVQGSALFNYAGTLSGVQIGLVNFAKEYKKGAAIGLLNFVKGGMNRFEISYDDIVAINGSYRSGTPFLYTILTAGIDPDKDRWTYGVGLGTQYRISQRFFGNVEATTSSLMSLDERLDGTYLMNRLNVNFGYTLFGNVALIAGPVLNIYVSHPGDDGEDPFGSIVPDNTLFDDAGSDWAVNAWVGYRAAIRF